jgi:anthranilate synthase/aminodeoxychorismate synthase-like glutamine amidotransferase
MWVLIDNYDSFTYILHHYLLLAGGGECRVVRNDEIDIPGLEALQPERIIISPGPETPDRAGITMEVVRHFHDKLPLLGVCLGHQALGMFFGAALHRVPPMHGKQDLVFHNGGGLFAGVPNPCTVMRYHSLALASLTGTGLQPLATTADGTLMALRHEHFPCTGVQFHPESIGTDHGLLMLRNWAAMDGGNR